MHVNYLCVLVVVNPSKLTTQSEIKYSTINRKTEEIACWSWLKDSQDTAFLINGQSLD